ncbi:MAG: ATPase, T2SS/T4P/T4SS family [Candidatus Woesearchaeota archaeon]
MTEAYSSYKVQCEGVSVPIVIYGKGKQLFYEVSLPHFEIPTLALIDGIKHRLVVEMDIRGVEVFDQKVIGQLKIQFAKRAEEMLLKEVPNILPDDKYHIISKLIREMLGLGDVEFLLADEELEEIVINSSSESVRVYHKKHGWLVSNISILEEAQILNYSNIIARRIGRQISVLTPLLDAHLVTGDRANSVLFPISSKGHTMTIRKFARDPWTVVDLVKNKTLSAEVFALLWLAFEYEMNVLFSGGTASGKTSMMSVCLPFIPPNHRIISIEDTREIQLAKHLFWTPLTTREPNVEGKGQVSMLDLLVNSLRMRPDRIILGEMRKQQEAEVLFEAMHTGHSVYATVHADTINETIMRLTNPPISTPANLLGAVDLNVVMFRDRRRGIRRVLQIGEFLLAEDSGRIYAKPNILYRWNPASDETVPHASSMKFFEKLSSHTGMSQSEINKNLEDKRAILAWLIKNNIRDIENVGKIIKEYYLDPEFIVETAKGTLGLAAVNKEFSSDARDNVVQPFEKIPSAQTKEAGQAAKKDSAVMDKLARLAAAREEAVRLAEAKHESVHPPAAKHEAHHAAKKHAPHKKKKEHKKKTKK